jgi:hypothetical protein
MATSAKTKIDVSIARLPVMSAKLFGREAELAWLDACWKDGVHVASIVAWGGVGKSALVNKWLAEMRDDGWRGADQVYAWSFYSQGTDRLGSSDEFFAEALVRPRPHAPAHHPVKGRCCRSKEIPAVQVHGTVQREQRPSTNDEE